MAGRGDGYPGRGDGYSGRHPAKNGYGMDTSSMIRKTYDLADRRGRGVYPSGKVRFADDDIESVTQLEHWALRVTLHNGQSYVVDSRHERLLKIL